MIKTKDDYPIMLEPIHIQEILDISRRGTYDFLNEVEYRYNKRKNYEFPVKRIGRLMKIPRDLFFNWIEDK